MTELENLQRRDDATMDPDVGSGSDAKAPSPSAASLPYPQPKGRFLWEYAVAIWGVHLLACLAFVPWVFTWTGLIVMLVGWYAFGSAINVGYHRLLAHRGFKVPRWVEYAMVWVALCCFQDTPIRWVTHHRLHHRYSDKPDDAHTPRAGLYWAHMGWLFRENFKTQSAAAFATYSRDLLEDPFYRWLDRSWRPKFAIYFAHAALFFVVGWAVGAAVTGSLMEGLRIGMSVLVWGVFVRTVVVWHATWSVNSLSHVLGYQTYRTKEDSRNNWFVAAVAGGEGWHNNHHKDQISARHGHQWWEFDLSWTFIWAMEKIGLATDVVRPRVKPRRKSTPKATASQ